MVTRREVLSGILNLSVSYQLSKLSFAPDLKAQEAKNPTRIILLGTKGGPRVGEAGRSNPATLLKINGQPYLIDCGYGVSRQLLKANIPLNKVRYIFITHHHADHNLEYGPLLYNAWITGLPVSIDSYGPKGLEKMTRDFFEYAKFDIEIRMPDEGRPDPRLMVHSHDFEQPGTILKNNDVAVSTCRVLHPPIRESYAYRFDAFDRSVVISGDTAYSPELAKFARGADVLVHEIMYLPGVEALVKRLPNAGRLRQHLLAAHTLPEDVGKVASEAGVKTLVLTHFVPGDDSSITDDQWTQGIRQFYKGQIIVGRDLMEI
jgi:ribonuclease BN (tRNA processing enzyme)